MSDTPMSRDAVFKSIANAWNELHMFIGSLSQDQITQPTDPAGWTVKDHIIHLAMWEKTAMAVLTGASIRGAMDIPEDVWSQGDDPINALMQQRYHDMPFAEVMQTFQQIHDALLAKLDTLSEAELLTPFNQKYPDAKDERPLLKWVHIDTAEHYREHIPWMATIAEKA